MSDKIIVGIDEAGRGPLAGPVVAAAVIMPIAIEGVADSKKLSPKKREGLFQQIMETCKIGVGISSPQEIDQINILQATMLAMERAYNNLNITADVALIDGNKAPKLNCEEVTPVIGGDGIIPVISAASIIAKVTRDRIMHELDQEFPSYLWHKNAGYGTKAHLEAIYEFGLTKHHRLSFEPIKSRYKK
ncbi:MAG: ribonuclease HII [Rickettsiales bacterium]|jgi:ribonuclease HII|nr:ribonuclease HII [Rickettsiales bacterium]